MHETPIETATPDRQATRARLKRLAEELGAFLAGSEDVFLDAGRRVAGLERRARVLVDGARAVGAFRTAAGSDDPALSLGRELARMDAHLRASRGGVAEGAHQLESLAADIERLVHSRSAFESIAPTLRMLGLNTRIENARAAAQYAGMESVALEVRRLGDGVEPKFRAVFGQAEQLQETVGAAIETAQAFLGGQGAASSDLLAEAQRAVDALQAMTRAGAEIADAGTAASESLTRDLGQLLVALQGHDATRQAVEHVLAELHALDAEVGGEEGGDAPPLRVAEVSRLLSAQVRGAREKFVASLEDLAGSLRAISGSGAELSRGTERFVASGAGAAAAQVVRRSVEGATRQLLQHEAHATRTGESMGGVVATVEEMGRSVKDILGIGTAVKIIALNALVETERAGQGGRVLAVLAQGIGALAGEVVQRTGEVSRALSGIAGQASALRAATARGGAGEGESIAGALTRLSVRLSEIQQGLQAAVTTMHEGSRALASEVEELSGRVARARGTAARLQEVEAALAALGAAAPAGATSHEARAYSRYTMESERAIHDQVVRGLVPDGGACARPAAPAPSGGADGLGSNVELF